MITAPRVAFDQQPRDLLRAYQDVGVTALQTTNTTIYTAPADADFVIEGINVANVTGLADDVTIYFVPDGGSAGTSNMVLRSSQVLGSTTLRLTPFDGERLSPGTSIVARCTTANSINLSLWGYEYSGTYG